VNGGRLPPKHLVLELLQYVLHAFQKKSKSGIATPQRELDLIRQRLQLASKIIEEIHRRRLTQSQAAAILGIDQPKISALKQGKLSAFSIERLMRFLLLLGRDIEIAVKEKAPITRDCAASSGLTPDGFCTRWRGAHPPKDGIPVQADSGDGCRRDPDRELATFVLKTLRGNL
jgi:predicted XRE-type DNA-binding protein